MTLSEIEHAIRESAANYGVRAAFIFGSHARGSAGPSSDVDLCVEFDGPTTMLAFMGFKEELERRLGAKVDLVTRRALHPALRDQIEAGWIRVA